MKTRKHREIALLFLCLLIGFALRFYNFEQKSLWIDEIHTFNDSRADVQGQLRYYKEDPTYLHPPLFFVLTHLFYPFARPERDLRIFPLIFGILSIPMIYLLSRQFSAGIAIPCTVSLTFMTYHIYFSQDGRMYSLVMFLGMAALYFFMSHLKTLKRRYLIPAAVCLAALFYTSYSSVLFIVCSQILWFYRAREDLRKPTIASFLILNGAVFLLSLPWLLFIILNYHGQSVMDSLTLQDIGSFPGIIYGILNDWTPHLPLWIFSTILLILFPFISNNRSNAMILLGLFIVPVGILYLYCKLLNVTQFITSRYFISFLPLFFIVLYLSLDSLELKFERAKKFLHLGTKLLFLILLILSNLIILFPYYRSEKQDFRGLVYYLNTYLRDGDKIAVGTFTYVPGILHYFRVAPKNRHYEIPFSWKEPGKSFEFKVSLVSNERQFTVYHSNIPFSQYVEDGSRLWILVGKGPGAREMKKYPSCALKGYFDGSFAMFRRFPSDASMYLFLWDPKSPGEKGIDMPVE